MRTGLPWWRGRERVCGYYLPRRHVPAFRRRGCRHEGAIGERERRSLDAGLLLSSLPTVSPGDLAQQNWRCLIHLIGRWLPDELIPAVPAAVGPTLAGAPDRGGGRAGKQGAGDRPLHDGELELLQRVASSSEVRVRVAVVEAARALAATRQQIATDLLAHPLSLTRKRLRSVCSCTSIGAAMSLPG